MKKVNSLILIAICAFTMSCGHNKGRFIISNESNFDIDSLSILPDSKMKLIDLKKEEHINHDIMMNKVKSDGSYFISFKNSETNQVISQGFGYYTNGYQVEDVIKIRILNDTILINSKFDDSY